MALHGPSNLGAHRSVLAARQLVELGNQVDGESGTDMDRCALFHRVSLGHTFNLPSLSAAKQNAFSRLAQIAARTTKPHLAGKWGEFRRKPCKASQADQSLGATLPNTAARIPDWPFRRAVPLNLQVAKAACAQARTAGQSKAGGARTEGELRRDAPSVGWWFVPSLGLTSS
jgi:hypothetical protein